MPSRVASYATHYSVPSSVIRSLDETAVCKVQPSDSTGTQQTIRLLILTRRHFVAQCFMMQNTVAVAKVTNKSGKHPRLFISINNSAFCVLGIVSCHARYYARIPAYYLLPLQMRLFSFCYLLPCFHLNVEVLSLLLKKLLVIDRPSYLDTFQRKLEGLF